MAWPGLGAALEAKLTSKAKGPVPLFLRFRRLFSFGNPKYPRRAGYGVNYTIVFVYVCFSICVCVLTLVLSVYIMSFCVCLSTCVCLSMSDCSCSRRGWTDQPTSGPSGVRELHYASSSHLPIIIIIITIITNWIKFIIIITTIMVIVIVLSSSKLPLDTSWDQASKNSSTNEPIVFFAWLFFSLATWHARCFSVLFNSGRRLFIVKFYSCSTSSLILMLTDLIPQSGTLCIVSVFVFVFMPPFWCSQSQSLKVKQCALYLYLFLDSDAYKWNPSKCVFYFISTVSVFVSVSVFAPWFRFSKIKSLNV